MKKRVLCIILALVIALAAFAGCSNNNDATQTIVTVGKGAYKETVTYSDLVTLFQNYGIYYVYYYGLSVQDTLDMLLESLIENRTMMYSATQNLPKVRDIGRVTFENRYEQFVTEEEYNEIVAYADKYISTLIDNQEKELIAEANKKDESSDDDESKDDTSASETIRTTPTDFEYLSTVPVDYKGTDTRAKAVSEFKKLLKDNADMSYEEYRASVIKNQLASKVMEKYREYVAKDVTVSDSDVEARYNTILAKELEKYGINKSAYVDKLKSIQSAKGFSGENYVLTVPKAGYGFALNLLIKFNDEQSALLKELQTKLKDEEITEEEYNTERAKLFEELRASDQRITWLTNYGYDSELFAENAFDGTATPDLKDGVQTRDETGHFKYTSLTAKEYTASEFLAKVNNVLGGVEAGEVDGFKIYKSDLSKKADFIDLIWQYGQDDGALNTELGYVCYADDSESTYVDEYQAASKALATCEEGSYVAVETDYGYHIIYLVKAYNTVGTENEYKSSEKNVEGTFSYEFYNELLQSEKDNYVTEFSARVKEEAQGDKLIKRNEKLYSQTVTILKNYLSSLLTSSN